MFEDNIHRLLEASALASLENNFTVNLEKAKEAAKLLRKLVEFRKHNQMIEKPNLDLKYFVTLTLALAFENSAKYQEALNTYDSIIKNKQYVQSGRLRLNMVNYLLFKYTVG